MHEAVNTTPVSSTPPGSSMSGLGVGEATQDVAGGVALDRHGANFSSALTHPQFPPYRDRATSLFVYLFCT